MASSFEELWEKCEDFHKENSVDDNIEDIVNELIMKINLYSTVNQKSIDSSEEVKKAKSRLMGEILFSLTSISLKENINIFNSLKVALAQHSINFFDKKYETKN
jgi:hypothetical protein